MAISIRLEALANRGSKMQKAKSRLKSTPSKPKAQTSENSRSNLNKKIRVAPTYKNKKSPNKVISRHVKQLPTLIISLPFYYATYYVLTNVYPEQIKHFLLPNSYLPLQAPLFLGNFFLFSFLTLSSRRGFIISLFIFILIFLKLQHVVFSWGTISILLILFAIIEIVLNYLSKTHANFSKKHHQKTAKAT